MPTQVQLRRGTTTQNESFTGAVGELSVDTTLDTIRVHDGSTAGGIRLAKYSEIQAGDITGVTAGTGLSGGGTSGGVTVNLSHLGIESLSDPNDDQIIFWDDSAGATAFLDITTGLDITATNLSFSHLGLESLTDPNADRIYMWDDSAGASAFMTVGSGLSVSGTTISVGTLNQDTTGNAATATALETARTIGGTSFDGTANITPGLATTATTLATARTIGGTSFDGSANITPGLATTATTLATARTINGVSFDGSANVTTLTAGTGVSVSGTAVSIGQAVATTDDVTFADIAATGNVTITGNLTINGTTTTNSSTNTTIEDALIELGTGTSGSPANDAGFVIERGSSDNAAFFWDESDDSFAVGTGSFTGASTGNLTFTRANFKASGGDFATVTSSGNITGNLVGNVTGTIQTAAQTNITSVGTLSALAVSGAATTSYTTIGSSAKAMRNVFIHSAGPGGSDGAVGDIWITYS